MDAGPSPTMTSSAVPFEDNALVPRRPIADDARFDVTAMVDLVFMMNIFFLVTWVGAALAEMDLPKVRHCTAADRESSFVISILKGPKVYLGEPVEGSELNPKDVDQQVQAAMEDAAREHKNIALIKAERDVLLRDVAHVAGIASSVLGVKLKLAVIEKNIE
jgi:biopolymer transport protein ExbD